MAEIEICVYDEHVDVVLMTLDMADGRIPVIAGTGSLFTIIIAPR